MNEQKMASGLQCAWVPVTDATGHVHMEAHWNCPTSTPVGPSVGPSVGSPTAGPAGTPARRAA